MTDERARQTFFNLIGEKLKLFKLFLHNAAMKHGVPIEDLPNEVIVKHVVQSNQSDQSNRSNTDTKSTSSVNTQLPNWAKAALLCLPGLLAGGIAGYLFNQPQQVTQPQQPQQQVTQPQQPDSNITIIEGQDQEESALQWIEDQGDHLP